MSVTQYIGARYVPLFAEPDQWTSDRAYEPLTIVLHEGNSYTSKQAVPIGIDILNTEFWACTGNYNAQVEAYRREVEEFAGNIEAAVEVANEAKAAVELETTARETADTDLQTAIDAEAAARETAINAEAAARETADAGLQTAIDAEAAAREAADNALASNIDTQALRFKTYSLANCTPLVSIETGVTNSKLTIVYDNYLKVLTLSGWLTFTDYLETPPTEILQLPNEIDNVISQVYQTCGGIISGTDRPWRSNDYAFADLYINPGRKLAIKSPQMIEGGTKGIYLNTVINIRPNIASA